MGRVYRVPFNAVAVTAQQDFFEILAATGKHCIIHEWCLTQSTEVGDTSEEGLNVKMNRGTGATSGSGGTTVTPVILQASDAAAGMTAEANNTTKMTAGGGSITLEETHNWNIRMPYRQIYTPETRPQIAPGERKTLELATTPADSITVSGYMIVEELG